MTKTQAGILYALIAAAGLGAITTQAKFVYAADSNAPTLMFVRFLLSTIVIVLIIKKMKLRFRLPQKIKYPALLVGVVWSGSMIAYLTSIQTISVSLGVLILYYYPVWVMLFSLVTGRLSFSILTLSLFTLAFVGLILMLGENLEFNWNAGLLFAILAAVGTAYTFLAGSKISPQLDTFVLVFWINLIGLLLIAPLAYSQLSWPNSLQGIIFLLGATFCYLFAVVCQFKSLSLLPADKAAFIFNLEPLISILLAVTFLQDQLSLLQWSGAILILAVLLSFGRLIKQ